MLFKITQPKIFNMKPLRFISTLSLVLTIISGCSTIVRYRSQQSHASCDTLVNIDVFGFRLSSQKPPESRKTLWDLNADAQSQLLKIYNKRYPDNKGFSDALNIIYLKNDSEGVDNDFTKKELRMIFSVSKNRKTFKGVNGTEMQYSPADRIEYLKISLSIKDPFLKFTGWNFFSTDYGTIDIASITSTRTFDLSATASKSASLNLTPSDKEKSGRDNGLSATGSASLSRKEEQSLKYRYLKLNGQLNEKEISMEEEGTRENDLTGNTIADVSLEFNRFPGLLMKISGLRDSTGKFLRSDKIKIESIPVSVPGMNVIKDSIMAEMTMEYVYRKVSCGKKSYQEWDDRIKYYVGRVSKPVVLLRASDYVPGFYSLGKKNSDGTKQFLGLRTPVDGPVSLFFSSYKEAYDFMDWLIFTMSPENKADTLKIGRYPLIFNGNNFAPADLNDAKFGIIAVYR
jgi:hypothetical protein